MADSDTRYKSGGLESPFINSELFLGENDTEWESHQHTLQAESPFLGEFEVQSEGLELENFEREDEAFEVEEFFWEQDEFQEEEVESYEGELLDLEGGFKGVHIESEEPYVEKKAKEQSPFPRMKFEFQTGNIIWRNDGKTATLLKRKYGPKDFLVDLKGVRLESETGGALEFETEWFHKWPKLKGAIEKAVQMTQDMNNAAPSKFEKSRKAFPFNVDHLRGAGKDTRVERGFWIQNPGKEGHKERILGKNEELEVQIIDHKWEAAIQSSEGFLLHLFESYLKHHEDPGIAKSVIDKAKEILETVRPSSMPATQLENLHSLLQIIVYYIERGQIVKLSPGDPIKAVFRLMSRTSFSSLYKELLSKEQKSLFTKIIKNDVILNKMQMGLNRKSQFFKDGYGNNSRAGPTIYDWLVSIIRGQDLLSDQYSRLSDAMGKYNVETKTNKKGDKWLIKFETRGTILGREKEANNWVSYASMIYKLASERRRRPVAWVLSPLGSNIDPFLDFIANGKVRDAVSLAIKQGISDENKLTDLIFHSIHPELGGRSIQKNERILVQTWLQARKDYVRPVLQPKPSPEINPSLSEGFYDLETNPEYEWDREDVVADEVEYLDYELEDEEATQVSDEGIGFEFTEGVAYSDYEIEDEEVYESIEARELDPVLLDIAEKVFARELPVVEHGNPQPWTKCFSGADIAKVQKVYEENYRASSANPNDRCSCIVMLNVALGQLLPLKLKDHPARSTRNGQPVQARQVQMAKLTTKSIENAMAQLHSKGFAVAPTVMNFFDNRDRTAGTLKPVRLKASVRDKILSLTKTEGCWFAFGLSIMAGYHSVLLLVNHTSAGAKIYWLDQFSNGLDDDVTNNLDQRLTDRTQEMWQRVMDGKKHIGSDTMIRIWPLRKRKKVN
jgi:hypothetical protein